MNNKNQEASEPNQHKQDYSKKKHSKKRRMGLHFYRRRSLRSKKRLQIRNRYEIAHMISEIATSLLFLAGSFCLFYPEVKLIGTCLFILGSIQMLVRALIRMSYMLKLKKWDYIDENRDQEKNHIMH
ncbi:MULTISPECIES: YrhK family protein [unclassified Paenibacillus]|uniref:YrhK family protein n=1 Tax=Paenibacillus provencensis TaxID=441151 RepID=A0ABW3PZT6_9BACL|nr:MULTISPECIES: YrhK family protein [unclassified Paenibacillus]MCM3128420.1 YrhK family protein [Paenibacillus sp. MER 78]SFS79441.1 YrhK-like protein [Paenibacillus sp. 453mf]